MYNVLVAWQVICPFETPSLTTTFKSGMPAVPRTESRMSGQLKYPFGIGGNGKKKPFATRKPAREGAPIGRGNAGRAWAGLPIVSKGRRRPRGDTSRDCPSCCCSHDWSSPLLVEPRHYRRPSELQTQQEVQTRRATRPRCQVALGAAAPPAASLPSLWGPSASIIVLAKRASISLWLRTPHFR